MSVARNTETKRVASIARAINWSYMWRRLMSYVWLDLLLVVIAAAILVYGYNQTLPDSAFTAGWIPGATVRGMSLKPARGWDPTTLTYTVELARTTKTFPLAQDLVALWPLYIVVVGWQIVSMLNMLGGARRVRRTMAPLNDLALRVDELGRMQLSGGKMETLEQAIERASVDSPSVTTGDADLASIEVALNRLLRQMQEAKLQQMRFVNDASHELRTPMAVIMAQCEDALSGEKTGADYREALSVIHRQGRRMNRMISGMLELVRMERKTDRYAREPFNLSALTESVCEDMALICEKNIALTTDVEPDISITGDQTLITRLLGNLIGNAYRYGRENGHIIVTLHRAGSAIELTVSDDGIGIAPDQQKKIFRRLYQGASERSGDGAGLGLAMARQIARLHGGELTVVSEEGKGSAFTARFPMQ